MKSVVNSVRIRNMYIVRVPESDHRGSPELPSMDTKGEAG